MLLCLLEERKSGYDSRKNKYYVSQFLKQTSMSFFYKCQWLIQMLVVKHQQGKLVD